jgi:two-component system chemotaxis sensor kinase CheA
MAIPLYDITRVETIEMSNIESIGEHPLTQYHGKLIPLVILEQPFEISETEATPLLILHHNSQTIGLVVHSIDDIFEDENHISIPLNLPGKKGIIVLNGIATDIIDTSYYLATAYTMFSPEQGVVFDKNALEFSMLHYI